MKKRGFTLSELLIALGIVAVTAAMVGPIFSSVIPDKNKIKVINYYNKINEINQKLLSNTNFYYTIYRIDENGEKVVQIPPNLDNQKKPLEQPSFMQDTLSGDSKYPRLFFYTLNASTDNNSEVKLEDGSLWTCKKQDSGDYTFTIDTDGKKGKNCSYERTNCKIPDKFIFKVDENGAVTAGDALTDAYLTNMTKNDQKADKELAIKYDKERTY